ncbi:alpha/beta fold hydrolase [Spirosoma sp. KCTC 42546]|uniref:YheT family hydrolase n=1 Tax=Spirosoma sp. KCTC 42546 TaxID=2520506 RepID=UPI00115843C2|nr:alpha/beta fold hydrolase [Spirosoma sp. KCTC 42546]QDK80951.1 alpha/beta fold hydrolase [Spirosoma sp. KCTC 42546]
MPLIAPSSYKPPTRLWNGHLQTIIPSLFRKVAVSYVRERIKTPDDDFLDLDWANSINSKQWIMNNAEIPSQHYPLSITHYPLVILTHGLEGSSTSPYLAGMVRHLTQNGFDCLAWHYRSCSGEMNRQQRFYHVGETGDLQLVIQHALSKGYQTIYLMGFSAGGNVTLKYLGEHGTAAHPAIKKAVVFSVPMYLMGSARRLEQWDSLVYNYRFNRTLKRKVLEKAAVMPGIFPTEAVRKVRSVREFDNTFTAPMNGFLDVEDYYTRSSSLQFIPAITIPTLIVNAKNDPFLSPECFPSELARELPNVWMEFPEQGGHCGFPAKDEGIQGTYWSEKRAVAFLTAPNLIYQ